MWSHSILLPALSSPGTNSSQLPNSTCNEFVEDPFFLFQSFWFRAAVVIEVLTDFLNECVSDADGELKIWDLRRHRPLSSSRYSIYLSIYLCTKKMRRNCCHVLVPLGRSQTLLLLRKWDFLKKKYLWCLLLLLFTHIAHISLPFTESCFVL